ncbi:ABC transporter substrate-binding protein [Oligella ureolytica]|jgi:NitT/TauT family transport system substrate-binding protein|nr:ABC transporter substrate-binding protein [Alcaligenaceae bacterium]HZJ97900.1 ABC transporter substrate-binding protein [Oligella sp.]
MDRRRFLQYTGAAALSTQIPLIWANTPSPLTVYGPGALPTILLGVAAQHQTQGQSKVQQAFNVQTWRSPDMLRAGLANGSIQASIVPSYVGVNLANRGMDVKLVNIMTWGLVDIVGAAGSIKSLKDLEGRSVAVPLRNDMPDLVLQVLCKLQGVDFKKININYTPTPAEAMTYWLNDRVEFAVLNEPLTSIALMRARSKGVERVLNLTDLWREMHDNKSQGLPQAGLLVTSAFYEQNAQFLKQLQEELQTSLAWTLENPAAAARIGSKILDVPAPAIQASIPHAHLTATAAADIREDLELFFSALYDMNPRILGDAMPKDNFILAL